MQPLRGEQYVRLAPGVAESVGPRLGLRPDGIRELALDLAHWPEEVATPSRRGHDGRLIAGDPLLVAVSPAGLHFAARQNQTVLVRWQEVRSVRALRQVQRAAK